ncbi:transcriptional regulator [Yersinia enterocolitica]|nr:transcriptional regulator [Yersinia enterocolitica]
MVIFIYHYQHEIKGFISLNVHTLTTSKKSPKFWGFIVTTTSKGFVDRFAPDGESLASLRRVA